MHKLFEEARRVKAAKAAAQAAMEAAAAKVVGVEAGQGLDTTGDNAIQADTSLVNYVHFLRSVLPSQGRICVWPKGGANVWFSDVEDFILRRGRFDGQSDVYFATAAFGDAKNPASGKRSRGSDNVLAKRCFYVDIDVRRDDGGHAGGYGSGAEARDALKEFISVTKLVPSYVVSTGSGGLHAYFVTAEDVAPDGWQETARALQRLCAKHGFRADPAITVDAARVLRLPGTKHGRTGRDVVISKATGKVFTNLEFRELVGVSGDSDDDGVDALGLGPVPEHLKNALAAGGVELLPMLPTQEFPPADFERIREQCGAVRSAVENPESASEPLWRGLLGVVRFCEGAETLAHSVSAGHAGYDFAETERKLAGWSAGPTSCQYFRDHAPDACAACPHAQGRVDDLPIFKTPIALSREVAAVEPLVGADGTRKKIVLPMSTLHRELPDWQVKRTAEGETVRVRPHGTADNIGVLARLLGWTIQHNVMARRTELLRDGLRTSMNDIDNVALQMLADDCVRHAVGTKDLAQQVDVIASNNTYHPVLDWIEGCTWDGVSRRAAFAESLALVDESKADLRNALLDAWMLTAVGALVEPEGIAAQGILTIQGGQGIGKTRWAASLCPVAGAVRCGMGIDPDSKDSVTQATSSWIVELGEIDGVTRRRDVSALKAFITRSVDVIRTPYSRKETSFKRRTAFLGTVNNEQFLMDATGNRRFWVVAVKECKPLAEDTIRQVWAEYLHLYRSGQRGHLSADTMRELNASNEDFEAADPIFEKLATSFDWRGVNWSGVSAREPAAMDSVLWLTSTDLCQMIGIERPTHSESTKAGVAARRLQGLNWGGDGGGETGYPAQKTGQPAQKTEKGYPVNRRDLARKSNGLKVLAVPKRRTTYAHAA